MAIKLGPERLGAELAKLGMTPVGSPQEAPAREPPAGDLEREPAGRGARARARATRPSRSTRAMRPYDLGLIGFGQGYAGQMTPFQMALVAAAVANLEGKLMKPKIEYDRPPEVWSQASSPQHAAEMRRIMGLVAGGSSGTATSVLAPVHAQGIITGGKTGTAEKQMCRSTIQRPASRRRSRRSSATGAATPSASTARSQLDPEFRIDSWFLCIAPLDRPQLAIAVIIEGGGYGAKAAAPVAAALVLKARDLGLLGGARRRAPAAAAAAGAEAGAGSAAACAGTAAAPRDARRACDTCRASA